MIGAPVRQDCLDTLITKVFDLRDEISEHGPRYGDVERVAEIAAAKARVALGMEQACLLPGCPCMEDQRA